MIVGVRGKRRVSERVFPSIPTFPADVLFTVCGESALLTSFVINVTTTRFQQFLTDSNRSHHELT